MVLEDELGGREENSGLMNREGRVYPLTGLTEGGTRITITGSNLGQKHQDIAETVTVAGIPCEVDALVYEISSSIVCTTGGSGTERSGHVVVEVPGGGQGVSAHVFTYQDPELKSISPSRGPKAGGTCLTLKGSKLLTGNPSKISILIGTFPCYIRSDMQEDALQCLTSPSNASVALPVTISGGREIRVHGHNLDVVQQPRIRVTVSPLERRRRGLGRWRRIIPETECLENALCSVQQDCVHLGTKRVRVCQDISSHYPEEFLFCHYPDLVYDSDIDRYFMPIDPERLHAHRSKTSGSSLSSTPPPSRVLPTTHISTQAQVVRAPTPTLPDIPPQGQ
ncbi:hypothetical protein JD844_013290 [Phrynosoma platyrhinos]|uniref:IPT/TIG domain-containing protein n=1 Tax=Phrynosoma platyrhinos TaxID=52577 RepID=A0ABQ7TLG1_PHRPL|nr:hypothetical protein JD844_013290 [Phrynosoma platyrhinos]